MPNKHVNTGLVPQVGATFIPKIVIQCATLVNWWVLGALLKCHSGFQVGAVADPVSHVCCGSLTLPFSSDWIGAKATGFEIGQTHKQTKFRSASTLDIT